MTKYSDRPCLGWRPIASDGSAGDYQFMSYSEAAAAVAKAHAGYASLGLKPRDHVGVIGSNSPELMISLQVGAGHALSLQASPEITAQGYLAVRLEHSV